MFWVVLSRVWPQWRKVLHLIEADTVVGWQRQGFRIYWAKISKQKSAGRRPVSTEVRCGAQKHLGNQIGQCSPTLHLAKAENVSV